MTNENYNDDSRLNFYGSIGDIVFNYRTKIRQNLLEGNLDSASGPIFDANISNELGVRYSETVPPKVKGLVSATLDCLNYVNAERRLFDGAFGKIALEKAVSSMDRRIDQVDDLLKFEGNYLFHRNGYHLDADLV